MKPPKSTEQRKREHVERMLARAERRHKQTGRLVEKWRVKLEELDRVRTSHLQPRLWVESEEGSEATI